MWYFPIAGESMNCEPPSFVQASTHTTTAGGTSPDAKTSSHSSGYVLAPNAGRLRHMSSWPVYPWIT